MPKTYPDLLREAREEIRRSHAGRSRRPPSGRACGRPRRARGLRMGPGPHPGRDPHQQELPRAAGRGRLPRSGPEDRPVLRGRRPFAVRRADAQGARLHRRRVDDGRLPAVEEPGPALEAADRAHEGAEGPLQPAPAHPRGRVRGPGEAARVEGAADRRRWPRIAGRAVSRRGGRRDHRDHRLRRRRRVQSPAPDHPHDRSGGDARRSSRPGSPSTR